MAKEVKRSELVFLQAKKDDRCIDMLLTLREIEKAIARAEEIYKELPSEFDYGPLNRIAVYKGTHPKVMQQLIKEHNWKDKLQYSGKVNSNRELHKHEKLQYRVITIIEKIFYYVKQTLVNP